MAAKSAAIGSVPQRLAPLGLSGVDQVVETGTYFVVRRAGRIEAIAVAPDGRPTPIATLPAEGRALFRVEGTTPAPRVFLRHPHGGGDVLAVDEAGHSFKSIATYRHDPWFLNSARSATWLLRAGAGHEVTVHRLLAAARSSLGIPKPTPGGV